MFCKKCGKEIPNDSIFCSYCGFKVIINTDEQTTSNKIQEVGKKMESIGKTLTIFVTLPIVIIFLIYLFYTCSR